MPSLRQTSPTCSTGSPMASDPDELIELPLTLQLRPEGEFWVARLVHIGASG